MSRFSGGRVVADREDDRFQLPEGRDCNNWVNGLEYCIKLVSFVIVYYQLRIWCGDTSFVRSIIPASDGRVVIDCPRRRTSSTTSPTPTAPTPFASLSRPLISLFKESIVSFGIAT